VYTTSILYYCMVYDSEDVVYTTSILYYSMVYDSGDVVHVVTIYCITVRFMVVQM